jgi:hypothetical protein
MRLSAYLALAGLTTLPTPAAAQEDPLWQSAIESASRANGFMSQTVTIRFMGHDAATGAICRRDGVLTLKGVRPDGTPDWDAVYTEDIVGLPPKGVADCTFGPEAKGNVQIPGFDCSPFLPSYQNRVSFERTGEVRRIAETECAIYEFEWELTCFDRKASTGQACLNTRDGTPVEIRYEHRKVPKGLRSAVSIVRYGDVGELGHLPVAFEIEVRAKRGEFADEPYRMTGEFREHVRVAP